MKIHIHPPYPHIHMGKGYMGALMNSFKATFTFALGTHRKCWTLDLINIFQDWLVVGIEKKHLY